MSTQNDALLKFMKTNKAGITTWTAFETLGITCVHKRIAELEAKGHVIHRRSISGLNRYGNPCRITKYRLGV